MNDVHDRLLARWRRLNLLSDVLVDPSELRSAVNGVEDQSPGYNPSSQEVRILDARSPRRYQSGHIPGAVNLPMASLLQLNGHVQELVPAQAFSALAKEAGLSRHMTVVVYGERGGMEAAYVFWALEYFGHPNVRFLDGGIEGWLALGGDLTTDIPSVGDGTFSPSVRRSIRAEIGDILDRLEEADYQLVDTRTPDEFTGALTLAKRGGHIPGAIRFDWESDLDAHFRFKSPDELKKGFMAAGIDSRKSTILYCMSGPRAAHVYVAMRHAGFDRLSLYDRSWSEWGGRDDLPIES